MAGAVIRIEGLGSQSNRTPFDGQYLVEFDPERDGVAPTGTPMNCHIKTTADRSQARVFASKKEALETYRQVSKRDPVKHDGKPNRPLTAFTVAVEDA